MSFGLCLWRREVEALSGFTYKPFMRLLVIDHSAVLTETGSPMRNNNGGHFFPKQVDSVIRQFEAYGPRSGALGSKQWICTWAFYISLKTSIIPRYSTYFEIISWAKSPQNKIIYMKYNALLRINGLCFYAILKTCKIFSSIFNTVLFFTQYLELRFESRAVRLLATLTFITQIGRSCRKWSHSH